VVTFDDSVTSMDDTADPGYWLSSASGEVHAYGAVNYGDMGGKTLNQPIVGIHRTPDGKGIGR
jgi:hypothetical protein